MKPTRKLFTFLSILLVLLLAARFRVLPPRRY